MINRIAILLSLFICISFSLSAAGTSRIVSLVPSQTELLFALGYGPQVVGISDYCNFPARTAEISKVGGLDLNVEKIMSLKPNLVLDLNSMNRKYQLLFSQLGLNYVNFNVSRLEDIPEMAGKICQILDGNEDKAQSFQQEWKTRLEKLSSINSSPLRVYLEIWDTPMQAAGPASFIGALIKTCGGENVIKESQDYPVVNSEHIIAADPEIILIAYPHPDLDSIKKRPGWSGISAIKKNRVHALDQDLFVRPGPRNLEALDILVKLFWPESGK
ncbi:MAG: helical backbone metal receptor [Candidatus Riflebacteria bacterium]